MSNRLAQVIKIVAILIGTTTALWAAALSQAAVPRAQTSYADPACVNNVWSPRCSDAGNIFTFTSKRAVFDANCPLPGGPSHGGYTDKDAFVAISGSGQYHFDSYITLAFRYVVRGRVFYRYSHTRLVVNGRFVTKSKTVGRYHVFKRGCRPTDYTWTLGYA